MIIQVYFYDAEQHKKLLLGDCISYSEAKNMMEDKMDETKFYSNNFAIMFNGENNMNIDYGHNQNYFIFKLKNSDKSIRDVYYEYHELIVLQEMLFDIYQKEKMLVDASISGLITVETCGDNFITYIEKHRKQELLRKHPTVKSAVLQVLLMLTNDNKKTEALFEQFLHTLYEESPSMYRDWMQKYN